MVNFVIADQKNNAFQNFSLKYKELFFTGVNTKIMTICKIRNLVIITFTKRIA